MRLTHGARFQRTTGCSALTPWGAQINQNQPARPGAGSNARQGRRALQVLALYASLALPFFCVGCRAKQPAPSAPTPPRVAAPVGPEEAAKPELAGVRVLMVVAPKDFRDEEYTMPRQMLGEAGASIEVASTKAGSAVGTSGTQAPVDLLASAAKGGDYDAVIFVGGTGMTAYLNHPDFVRLAKESAAAGKVTAAICVAPSILANAGVLQGVEATVWKSEQGVLKAKGATLSGKDAVRSGKIVTANGPAAAHQFGLLIIETLKQK